MSPTSYQLLHPATVKVEGEGFEPSKAEPTDLQSVPFGRSGTPPNKKMAPQTGLEPVTSWLTVMRSTDWAIEEHIPAMTYSPTKRIRSTIGAGGLNFCVRDGYRCDPSAIITRIIFFSLKFPSSGSLKTTQCIMFQPYIHSIIYLRLGQALDILVSVSSMDHSTYTPDLSTRSSFWCLTSL